MYVVKNLNIEYDHSSYKKEDSPKFRKLLPVNKLYSIKSGIIRKSNRSIIIFNYIKLYF